MFRKTLSLMLSAAMISAVISGCSEGGNDRNNSADADGASASPSNGVSSSGMSAEQNEAAAGTTNIAHKIKETNTCTIDMDGDVYICGNGASYEENVIAITKGGTYTLSGRISDAYLYIDTDENVKLIMNGVSIRSGTGSAIYCYSAENLYIELNDGTENTLEDASIYSFGGKNESASENEPDAALYCKTGLFIYGGGSLSVNGNYQLGIRCSDDLTIEEGNLTVTSVTNGVRGGDSVTISGGSITVTAQGDGIKTTDDTDSGRGTLETSVGVVNVNADDKGIQPAQAVMKSGGNMIKTAMSPAS